MAGAFAAILVIHDDVLENLDSQILSLYDTYRQTQELQYLQLAVEATRQGVMAANYGRFHARFLHILSSMLFDRFQRTGADADLDESIKLSTKALELTPDNNFLRAVIIMNLAATLRQRSYKTFGTDDLEKGIQLCREALGFLIQNVHIRQGLLSTLGTLLGLLFRRRSDVKNLEEAIQVSRESIELAEPTSDDKASAHNNLGNRLENLYDWTGNPDHLNEAIQCAREAVRCTMDEIFRASRLSSLGIKLVFRYDRTMDLDDLNDAVECLKQAARCPLFSNNADWPSCVNFLARGLFFRYQRTGDENSLKESLRFQRQGIDHHSLSHDHPSRPALLEGLGMTLLGSYQKKGQIGEIVDAIKAFREAAELRQACGNDDHPMLLAKRHNLGMACYTMYCRVGSQSSALLKEILQIVESVASRILDDDPSKAIALRTSGMICETLGHSNEALGYYVRAAENQCGLPIVSVQSARHALRIYRNGSEWDKAIVLARNASKLLPLVCSRYISIRDQEHVVTNVSGFAADVCSLLLMSGRPEEALQQLEFGRGLILSYLVDKRSDLSAMKEDPQAYGLVERYENLRDQLSHVAEVERPSGTRDHLVDEIEKCAEDIRKQTKYKRFLLGASIEEITSAAANCPIIVVNSTDIASHAIIIWQGQVTSLPLEQLSIETASEIVRKRLERYGHTARGEFQRHTDRDIYELPEDDFDFLSWLWDNCVRLILDKLESLGLPLDGKQRVWWIGTGAAGSFPFHAAGMHSTNVSECTLMKVISSYATTIKTLKFSMIQSSESTQVEGPNTLLFVGMPTTPGGSRTLPGVYEEESVIREACGEKYRFEVRRHPTASEVLEEITKSKVVHFACRGSSDPRLPSKSHLLLQTQDESGTVVDRLTVERLSKVKAKDRSFLAFLSACSTAEVKASNNLADEAIHLASIFQVAGFAHTIGTLWSASDQACVQVAKEFYRILIKDGDGRLSNDMVARALHSAVQRVKLTAKGPEIWAPFIHFGA